MRHPRFACLARIPAAMLGMALLHAASHAAAVQQWNFEGNGFNTTAPTVAADVSGVKAATCPAGTTAVLRAYNNAYPLTGPKNPWDSNHRFVRAQADINAVVGDGWRSEGTV